MERHHMMYRSLKLVHRCDLHKWWRDQKRQRKKPYSPRPPTLSNWNTVCMVGGLPAVVINFKCHQHGWAVTELWGVWLISMLKPVAYTTAVLQYDHDACLFAYLLQVVNLYRHCVRGTSSQCIVPRSCLHWIHSFWSMGQNPWSWRIFIKHIWNLNVFKNMHNSLWGFSPTSELRIILWRHTDCRQVCQQWTNNHCLSISVSIQICAQHDDDWVWCNLSRGPLVSAKTCHQITPVAELFSGHSTVIIND